MVVQSHKFSWVESLVQEAGTEIQKYWHALHREKKSVLIEKKSDGSFVSEADFASNQIIIRGITQHDPDAKIHSEEGPQLLEHERPDSFWVIDPLDGTQSFVEGADDFSVLVALIENGKPVYGCMYFPEQQVLASAFVGQGAFVNGIRCTISQEADLRQQSVYCRRASLKTPLLQFPQWMDSGMAFLKLARSELDGVVLRRDRFREWDIAAPALIVEESGGCVSDEEGNALSYFPGALRGTYIVGTSSVLSRELLAAIEK